MTSIHLRAEENLQGQVIHAGSVSWSTAYMRYMFAVMYINHRILILVLRDLD